MSEQNRLSCCACSACSACSACRRCACASSPTTVPCDEERTTCNGQRLFYCGPCGTVTGETECKGCCPRCYALYDNPT